MKITIIISAVVIITLTLLHQASEYDRAAAQDRERDEQTRRILERADANGGKYMPEDEQALRRLHPDRYKD